MCVGLYLPIVFYPFCTPNSDAKAIQFAVATKGILYQPKINELEIVIVDGKIEDGSKLSFKKIGHLAIPYKYTYAIGITMFFVGVIINSAYRKQ